MKTMNKKITGIAAAVSLLTVMAGSVYAAEICCKSGTVVEAGSVFYNSTTGFSVATSHGATLLCDAGQLLNDTNSTWPSYDATKRTFELVGTTKDAMLAAALTALADDKKVWFCFTKSTALPNGSAGEPTLNPSGNVIGHIKTLYVTTTPTP